MKKYLIAVVAVVMACGFSSTSFADKLSGSEYDTSGKARVQQQTGGKTGFPQWSTPKQNEVVTPSQRSQPSTSAAIQNNQHIAKYMPGGLVETGKRMGIACTDSGALIQGQASPLYCRNFTASDGSSWRVAFSQKHQGNAERVFKMTNHGPQLWVQFKEGGQQVAYESSSAQQYAYGGSAPQVAQGKQQAPIASGNPCAGLSGLSQKACEAAKNAASIGILGR